MKILKIVMAAFIAMTIGCISIAQGSAYAVSSKDSVCQGIGSVSGDSSSNCSSDSTGGPSVDGAVATAINIFSWIAGITAVIMVIVGGFQYVTSGGDSGKVGSAKNTILYALIGIVIVALAQVIVKFVVKRFV